MTIELKPEQQRMIDSAIRSGAYHNSDEVISTALAMLAEADLFVHPSLHDSGSWACLEALAAGCPVVCFDIGGPGVLVPEGCGVCLPAINPRQAVEMMAEELQRLGLDVQLRREMGDAGKKASKEHYSWDSKGNELRMIYLQIANAAGIR